MGGHGRISHRNILNGLRFARAGCVHGHRFTGMCLRGEEVKSLQCGAQSAYLVRETIEKSTFKQKPDICMEIYFPGVFEL